MNKELEHSKVWLVIKKPKYERQFIQVTNNRSSPNPEYWAKAKIIKRGLNYNQAFDISCCINARMHDASNWIYTHMTIKDWNEKQNLQMMITETLV